MPIYGTKRVRHCLEAAFLVCYLYFLDTKEKKKNRVLEDKHQSVAPHCILNNNVGAREWLFEFRSHNEGHFIRHHRRLHGSGRHDMCVDERTRTMLLGDRRLLLR